MEGNSRISIGLHTVCVSESTRHKTMIIASILYTFYVDHLNNLKYYLKFMGSCTDKIHMHQKVWESQCFYRLTNLKTLKSIYG
jgi:hypothetical protein